MRVPFRGPVELDAIPSATDGRARTTIGSGIVAGNHGRAGYHTGIDPVFGPFGRHKELSRASQ